jgi:L-seryl-tRNA(Ser) seleniumtransferase
MEHIPVLKMLAEPLATTQKRASALQRQIGSADGLDVRIVETIARAGAGSLPQQDLPSRAVAVTSRTHTANELAQALRRGAVPVMGRLSQDRLLLDVRTLMDDEVAEVAAALKAALNG